MYYDFSYGENGDILIILLSFISYPLEVNFVKIIPLIVTSNLDIFEATR